MPESDYQAKVHRVMSEFKRGTLRSSSGKKVTKRKQAVAIGLSEARRRGKTRVSRKRSRKTRRRRMTRRRI